jgi:hypothetical protein
MTSALLQRVRAPVLRAARVERLTLRLSCGSGALKATLHSSVQAVEGDEKEERGSRTLTFGRRSSPTRAFGAWRAVGLASGAQRD